MTQVAEFRVAHLYPPYQGKGKASIVSDKGDKYKCEESQLAQFQEGEDVAIHYLNESFVKNGETIKYKKFHSKISKTLTPQLGPALNGAAKDQRILESVLMKTVQIPFSDRQTMANAMTEVWLAAKDTIERMLEDEIPY